MRARLLPLPHRPARNRAVPPPALARSNMTGEEVHADGEIYAAAMWRLKELYEANSLTASDLLQDWFGGLLYTASDPTFDDMRDGMRAWMKRAGYPDADERTCLVWRAFAQFGIGLGAWSGFVNGDVKIVESFTLPPGC